MNELTKSQREFLDQIETSIQTTKLLIATLKTNLSNYEKIREALTNGQISQKEIEKQERRDKYRSTLYK